MLQELFSQSKSGRLALLKNAPVGVLVKIIAIIWFAETSVTILRDSSLESSALIQAIVDATILSFLSAPTIWFFIFRPLRASANQNLSHLLSIEKALDASAIVIMTDPRGKVIHVNAKYGEITGSSSTEALGLSMNELIQIPNIPDFYAEAMAPLQNGQIWRGEVECKNKSGEAYWVDATVIPVFMHSKKAPHYIAIQYDISERKNLEQNLLKAKDTAERATKAKGRFLANISHEIRTPMNGILGMTNLLHASVKDPIGLERLNVIENCGANLLELIDDILDFSKLEADKVVLEEQPFSPAQAIEDIVDLLKFKAEEKSLSLNCQISPQIPGCVRGDVTRFRQILTNLIGNAIKFTNKGEVRILSSAKELPAQRWRLQFAIQDSGIGITQELQSQLFQSFSQVDASTTRRFGGSGLGLAICKGLCEKMGGQIWVESKPGVGSTFSFFIEVPQGDIKDLPVARKALHAFPFNMAKDHHLRILVVEDNPNNRMVLIGFLDSLGYQADVAWNGKEALLQMQRKTYDLVLMDCHMPELDGFETTEIILQQLPPQDRPRIVAVTASLTKEDVQKCLRAGMNDVIGKPISLQSLISVLAECPATKTVEYQEPSFEPIAYFANFPQMTNLAHQTIESFLEVLPKFQRAIQAAVQAKNAKAMAEAAHALKGSLSNFFARPSYRLVSQIEAMGKSGDISSVVIHVERLDTELQRLANDLRSALRNVA